MKLLAFYVFLAVGTAVLAYQAFTVEVGRYDTEMRVVGAVSLVALLGYGALIRDEIVKKWWRR